MVARTFWTGLALVFSIAAFFGFGPSGGGPLNSFGLLFLFIAAVIWRCWRVITWNSGRPALEGVTVGLVDAGPPRHVVPEVDPGPPRAPG